MASDDLQLEFHGACAKGHHGLVVEYLNNPSVSIRKKTNNRTPLLETCFKGHARTAAVLISAGSDVNAKDHDDFSCMHAAALHGFTEILDLLLRHGANLEALDNGRSTPFAMASFNFHESAMRFLADRGANVSPVAQNRISPLNFACTMGVVEKVRLLLQLGSSPQARASAGVRDSTNAVLSKAGEGCLVQVINYMWPPPAPAAQQESVQGRAPVCAWGRNLAIAEMLIAAGADLKLSHHSISPVHFAAGIGSRRLMTSLLRAGANPFSISITHDGVGSTPLSWAAACSRPVSVRLLLQAGALEMRDQRGRLPRQAIGSYVSSLPTAPEEEVKNRAVAVRHALLRAHAFRATSFLWPVHGLGQKTAKAKRRSLAVRRYRRRGKPALALPGIWRYANKAG